MDRKNKPFSKLSNQHFITKNYRLPQKHSVFSMSFKSCRLLVKYILYFMHYGIFKKGNKKLGQKCLLDHTIVNLN